MKKSKQYKIIITIIILSIIISLILLGIFIINNNKEIEKIEILELPEDMELSNKKDEIVNYNKFAHVSIDDFIEAFRDITENEDVYESIFENKLFKSLKDLHEKYGVKISCYIYYRSDDKKFDLSMCTDKFSEEFKENSSWLKFGFHTRDAGRNYESLPGFIIKNDYDRITDELLRITGSEQCIDKVIRLQSFYGSHSAIKEIQETEIGIIGLLSADDTRRSYSLNDEDNSQLYLYDYFEDENNIKYFKTDIRLENIVNIKTTLQEIDIENNSETNQILTIFTHEWKIYEDDNILKLLNELCEKIASEGYEFDYPMNRINNIGSEVKNGQN